MNFSEIARIRQSCRNYNSEKPVEKETLEQILESARLAPSACNGQPYKITVCRGEAAKRVARATMGMGMNRFTEKAPVMIVISEDEYVKTAAFGAKVKKNDYRSIDIGIVCAHIALEAAAQGLGTCILGWFDDQEIRGIIGFDSPVRVVISLGYPAEGDPLREKKRKAANVLFREAE